KQSPRVRLGRVTFKPPGPPGRLSDRGVVHDETAVVRDTGAVSEEAAERDALRARHFGKPATQGVIERQLTALLQQEEQGSNERLGDAVDEEAGLFRWRGKRPARHRLLDLAHGPSDGERGGCWRTAV